VHFAFERDKLAAFARDEHGLEADMTVAHAAFGARAGWFPAPR
jgi:hypothetical protein